MVGQLIALLLAVIAVALIPIAIWTGAGVNVIFTPATWLDGLAEQNIYEDIVPVALPALLVEADAAPERLSRVINNLPPEERRAIANDLIPPDWLQAQVESSVTALFNWLNGDSTTLEGTIDIGEVRRRLVGQEGQQAVARLVQAAPACTDEELRRLLAASQGQGGDVPLCHPPEEHVATANQLFSSVLAQAAANLGKDQILLADFLNGQPGTRIRTGPGSVRVNEDLLGLRLMTRAVQQMTLLFYLCPASIFALMVIATVRSLKSFGRWMSWPNIAGGALTIIPVAIAPFLIIETLTEVMVTSGDVPEIRLFETRLATGILTSAFGQFVNPVIVQAATVIVLGFILLGIAIIARAPLPLPEAEGSTASKRRTVTIPNTPARMDETDEAP